MTQGESIITFTNSGIVRTDTSAFGATNTDLFSHLHTIAHLIAPWKGMGSGSGRGSVLVGLEGWGGGVGRRPLPAAELRCPNGECPAISSGITGLDLLHKPATQTALL